MRIPLIMVIFYIAVSTVGGDVSNIHQKETIICIPEC